MSRDPGMALLRALAAGAPPLTLVEMESRDWASATFTGARHAIRLSAGDDARLAAWLDGVADASVRIAGHTVVEVAVSAVERQGGRAAVTLSALTVQA